MNKELKRLYQSVILKQNKAPHRYEKREDASFTLEAYNQICGDRFKLFFDMENDRIQNLSFYGFGCAISKASTAILIKKIEGKSKPEIEAMIQSYFEILQEGPDSNTTDEELKAFSAAKDFPGRMKCATLSGEEMKRFLIRNKE